MNVKSKKKLIEVALPLEAINKEGLRRKQKAPKGWPTSFHKWWAQRPLAAARAVIFAQMVDDPSANPELFPTEELQEKERLRLFEVIEALVLWDNTENNDVLQKARNEIWQSWKRACDNNIDNPEVKQFFDSNKLPKFYDPFAGSGSLPLSAQWLGLESIASDLNPVAVLINKALLEIPPKFESFPPVNPKSRKEKNLFERKWHGALGLAEDVRYYTNWIYKEADKRIGHLYPKAEITSEIVKERPDLKLYEGQKLTVVAWLWARTVKSPNPAYSKVDVPLVTTFMLSTKAGKEAYVEPVIEGNDYHFNVKLGTPKNLINVKNGTKAGGRGNSFLCIMSGTPITFEYLRIEAKAGRMGTKLLAIVAEGTRGRVFLNPTILHEEVNQVELKWKPDLEIIPGMSERVVGYGFRSYSDIFTPRQLNSLVTFSDLISEVRHQIEIDAIESGMTNDNKSLALGGIGATAYVDALSVYLACVVDRMAYYGTSLTTWLPKDNALRDCMPRQSLGVAWDFAEGNPFAKSSGDIITCSNSISNYLEVASTNASASVIQADAQSGIDGLKGAVISTDPPYYDNIGYADLSDFFYVWLRRSLIKIYPELFSTLAVPKSEELVATPHRHGGKVKAEAFFLEGMSLAMKRLVSQSHPAFPITIYYAFKQSETESDSGTTSTGWQTFLSAVINAGLSITGTWPIRTEGAGRMVASGKNALASSIILVCRPIPQDAPSATRREFVNALKSELPMALAHLQRGNIAPVDLAQAAIGPGMAVYTRYSKVLDAEGNIITVRGALSLINQVLDEALAEQEGDFDDDSRWALTWFEQLGFEEGNFGMAEQLSKSKNTSVHGLVEANILESKRGKVRLLKPDELSTDWDPATDNRLTNWETVHQLIRVLANGGENAASNLVFKLGNKAEIARELCYRLYTICERKKRTTEALAYNGLVQSWPEIVRLSRDNRKSLVEQSDLFNNG